MQDAATEKWEWEMPLALMGFEMGFVLLLRLCWRFVFVLLF